MRFSVLLIVIISVMLVSGSGCNGKVSTSISPMASPSTGVFSSPIAPLAKDYEDVILFVSFQGGRPAIYATAPDGVSSFQILSLPETSIVAGHMDWSLTAMKLAFGLMQGDRSDIFITDLENPMLNNITVATPHGGREPRWSPEGDRLAYVCGDFEPDICVISVIDGRYAQLTFHPSRDTNPSWSPDGKAIAYQTNRGGLSDIYVINLEDQTDQTLTLGVSQNANPVWSPDGEMILFQSDRDGSMDIFVISLKDYKITNLTRSGALDSDPLWSPNGEYIAFRSNRDGEWDLFVMKRDGSGTTNLTAGWGPVFTYAWSPDSRSLVFASGYQSANKIYKVGIDDRKLIQLTFGSTKDASPIWISLWNN